MAESPAAVMRQLHDEHAGALWSFCLHLTGNDRAHAEDVAQETLLRAWRNAAVLEESRGSVRSWLSDLDTTEDRTDELLLSWVVAEALTHLSDEHRAVLLECYYRGRSVADAARRLGIPEGTVKSRTHYALRSLKLALEELGVGR